MKEWIQATSKLFCEHLTAQNLEMIDKTVPAEYQKALAKIERKEEVKQKHRIIQAKF